MKKFVTKKEVRNELQQQIDDFLSNGGEVAAIDTGVSGREDPSVAPPSHPFAKPKEKRTPVLDSLASIEARRKGGQTATPKPKPTKHGSYR